MRRTESLAPYRSVAKRVTQCASLVTEPVRCVRACHPVPNEPISASKRARARCVRACQSVSEEPSQLARNHECVRLNSELWIKLTTPGIDPDSWAGLLLRDSMMLPRKSLCSEWVGWRGIAVWSKRERNDASTLIPAPGLAPLTFEARYCGICRLASGDRSLDMGEE